MDNNNAVTKEVPTGTKVQAIGTVKTVVGEVKAVDPSGTERLLQAGDKVYPNETIMTAVGALVLIEFINGTHLDLPSASQIVLDSEVFDPSSLNEGGRVAGEGLTAEQIQEMIARGEDPTAITEATAAGAGAGDEGGASFVVVGFNDTKGAVTSGFNTIGIPGPESTTFTELPPVEDEAVPPPLVPAVSVSVAVDVEVGEGEGVPGEDGVIYIPSGSSISGGVSGANVIEGSDGFMHTVTFLIKLNAPTTVPVTITYTIIPETATYGAPPTGDFFDGGLTKTVTIPAGFIGFLVSENIVADIKVEDDETFRIVLSDPVNATLTNDSATVTIIDDDMNPVANDDTNWVQEDNFGEGESVTASGNVLQTAAHPGDPSDTLSFSDTADADDNPLILTWGSEAAVYGNIVRNPDGTYTYTLNNSNPAVQGLSAGETLTETFTYTITDGVNTPDNATLTITIFGADDGVTIRGIGSTQGDETVLESHLPAGSSPDVAALTQVGSFDIVASDGIQTVTIGGMSFTLAQVQAFNGTQVINTPYGALTLTGYVGDGQSGTISYSYTLNTTVDNDTQAAALGGSYMESIAVTVTDEDGSFSNSTLNINIVDDVPTAANDGPYGVVEDGMSVVSGNVLTNDASGADVTKVFEGWSAAGHNNTTSLTELAKYGTLVQNGDGSWSYTLNNADPDTQALTAASNLSYDLWYTMKDADGDLSPAKLTITITGANDNASVVTAQATGPDNTVLEAGLNPNGSNAAANSETSTGSFTVSSTDGILNLNIGGTLFTLAQMQAFNGTQTVNTGEGVLTLTSYVGNAQGGTVNYSYTLSATIDNDSKSGATGTEFDDSLVLTVNGVGGTTASDNLVVRIVDDVPTAANDPGGTVMEDGASSLSGNVLSNDASGADTPATFVSWGADTAAINALNTYGTLTQNANGTWSYVLDNSRAATQALSASFNQSYTLNYTMQDADGDTSPAQLTITVRGANDNASVVTAQATGPDNTVYEAGLNPNGSNAAANTESSTGSFTVSASDGILNLVIGGTTYTLAQMQAFNGTQTVNTGEGVLTLTSYSGTATSGTVNYSYTLSATIDNDSKSGATGTEFDDSVLLTVNGVGGTTASDSLVVRIMDDMPTAANDGPYGVVEDGTSMVSGNVLANDAAGADVAKVFDSWTAAGHDNTTSLTELAKYGTLVQNADGTWSYTLNNADQDTQALTAASNLSYDLWYTMKDADGDASLAKLTITITGANDSATVVTAQATGADNTVYEAGLNPNGSNAAANTETSTGTFTVSATDGILNMNIGGTVYTFAQMQAFNGAQTVNTGEGVLTLTGYSGTATSGTVSYSYTLSATIDNDSKAGATGIQFDDSLVLTVNGVGGSTASDNLVVRIVDDAPLATAALLTGNVDEDGVPGGIAGGTGDLAGEGTTASGSVATLFTSGADVPLSYSLSASTVATLNALGLKSNNVTLTYTVAGDTVTAKAGANTVFTFQLTAAGAYTFTLMDQLDHATGSNENDLAIALGGIITATDADGDTVTANASGLVITVDDDSPVPFAPTDGLLNNVAGDNVTESLNSLSKLGADNYASGTKVVFSAAQEGNSGLTTGGVAINYYVSADGKTLTGSTAGNEGTVTGANTVFTVQINDATDQYTVTMLGTIDNNSGSVFGNLSGTGEAGNPSFKIVESTSSDPLEILFTPLGTATSVNSDSNDVAVGSQFIIDGDGLRINFGKFHNDTHGTGTGADDTFVIDESSTINGFRFSIDQISGGTTATMLVSVYDNQNPPPVDQNINNDVQDLITKITVYNAGGTKIGDFTGDATIGGVTVDFMPSGTVQIQGLQTSYSIVTTTASGYDSIKIYNDATNGTDGKFSLSNLQVEHTNAGEPVYDSFATILTDADGDTSSGVIDVTFAPAAAITGTSGADNMAASATSGSDIIYGGAGNDILVGLGGNDVLAGGPGSDTLTGGAGRDTFTFTREVLGENSADTVTDFTVGASGDVLDISDILDGLGVTATNATVGAYLKISNDGTNTTISIDVDGGGAGTTNVTVATLQGVTLTQADLATLLTNGQVDHTS